MGQGFRSTPGPRYARRGRGGAHPTHGARLAGRLLVVALAVAAIALLAGGAGAVPAPVGLGTADTFAVLAGSTVTNTGPSVISGDLGVSPGSAVTGFPPGLVNNGTIHAADAVASQAQADATVAYNDAAGRPFDATVGAELGGQTFVSGVYRGGTLGLTGTVTLDGQNDPNAVFIFQAATTLITASTSQVALINGVNPCNVFWQVGSSATLGTNSVFVGTILALTSVTANTGARVTGRLMARTAAVTLDSNTVTRPLCAGPTTTTPGSTSSTAPGGTTTTALSGSTTTSLPGTTTTVPVPGTTTTLAGTTTTLSEGTTTTSAGSLATTTTVAGTATTLSTTTTVRTSTAATLPPVVSAAAGTRGTGTLVRTGGNPVAAAMVALLALVLGGAMLLASPRRTRFRRH